VKENREQSRSLFSLVTAEAIWKRRKLTLVKGGLPSETKQTPGGFLKDEEKLGHTPHSTIEKNNSQELEEGTAEGTKSSPLAKTLEMLGIKNSEKMLTEVEPSE
jgi:hypothetical protein